MLGNCCNVENNNSASYMYKISPAQSGSNFNCKLIMSADWIGFA